MRDGTEACPEGRARPQQRTELRAALCAALRPPLRPPRGVARALRKGVWRRKVAQWRAAAGNLRVLSVFGGHGAALQLAPVWVAESSALQAGAGAVLLRPRRAVRG